MLTLALLLALGQVNVVARPLPGIAVGNVVPFTGRVATNFVHGDVDQDGDNDLLLPSKVYLQQEDGTYDAGAGIPLPAVERDVDAQFYEGRLYYRSPGRLIVHKFQGGAWNTMLDQALTWSGSQAVFASLDTVQPEIRFRNFLHDLDGDLRPELIAIDHSGIHLFRLDEDRYVPAGTLELPATIVAGARAEAQSIWPDTARNIVFPEQQMSSRLLFDGRTLRIVSIRERLEGDTVYSIRTHPLSLGTDGNFGGDPLPELTLDPVPAFVRPCHLNDDGTMDFAGGRWLRSETSVLPASLYESWATLDGGKTFHVRRAAAYVQFRPHCAFVDFDSDGDMDMITESTLWPRGSVREQLNLFFTEDRIHHEIALYQQQDGVFSEQATLSYTTTLRLEAPPVNPGTMLSRYEAGSLLNVTGDMNGDGFRDLLIRSGPEKLELFLADGWQGFEGNPAWTLELAPDAEAYVVDLNSDGVSDIYIRQPQANTAIDTSAHPGTAYFAKGIAP